MCCYYRISVEYRILLVKIAIADLTTSRVIFFHVPGNNFTHELPEDARDFLLVFYQKKLSALQDELSDL